MEHQVGKHLKIKPQRIITLTSSMTKWLAENLKVGICECEVISRVAELSDNKTEAAFLAYLTRRVVTDAVETNIFTEEGHRVREN